MEKFDLYKCEICGNIVQIVINGGGEMICCGKPMQKLQPQTKEEAIMEKHVPIFVKLEEGTTEIRVGEVLHPMTNEHYLMFIQAISEDKNFAQIKYLYPDNEPKMELYGDYSNALEYCNIHGLWEGKNA